MSLVSIINLETVGSDERGATLKGHFQKDTSDFLFLTRKAGSTSGNTYHEGKNKGTKPKVLVLLQGAIEFSFRKIGDSKVETIIIEEPAVIKIEPMVTHAVKTITDSVFLEANSIDEIKNDRNYEVV